MPPQQRFQGTTATNTGPAFVERRQGYRQAVRATGMLRPIARDGDAHGIPIHVFELSMSGVGFSASMPLEIGTVYRFDLCEKRQTPRRAEIRSCRQRPDGMFDVGARFC
jgi:hypothetical protein